MFDLRRFAPALAALALSATFPIAARADDPRDKPQDKPATVAPGDDKVEPFVPKTPRSVEDRERIEALQEYSAARALEDQRLWSDAVAMYEKALAKRPDSAAVLRRLSGLCFALGRTDQAVDYGRRVLENDPGDQVTLISMVTYYEDRKRDPEAAEALLTKVRDNPKTAKGSAGSLLVLRTLGDLYADRLNKPEKAADAYTQVLDALDDKAAAKLSSADQRRILAGDEVESYTKFGTAFAAVKRYDLAVRAYERGMAYEADNQRLPILVARALLDAGQDAKALSALEPLLKNKPPGTEAYELLGRVLDALKRGQEFAPRLEEALKADPKNILLQYTLAEAYRKAGQAEKAEAALKALLASGSSDPQVLAGLSSILLKEKKYEDLVKVLGDVITRRNGFEAIRPTLDAVMKDPVAADALIDAGVKLQDSDPAKLSKTARLVLVTIAFQAKKPDKLVALQHPALKREPSPQGYRELFESLIQLADYANAAAILDEMLEKYPDEKNEERTDLLARLHSIAGHMDKAMAVVDAAIKADPNDRNALLLKASFLGREEKNDEAIALYQDILKRFEDDDTVKKARSGLSIIYVNQDKIAEGERELEILLKKDPEDAGINNDLGYLYADQGKNLEKAESMIRKALEEEPANNAYLDSLGWVLYKRGKFKDAVEPLEQAARSPDVDATIHDHLGDVYYSLKEPAKARAEWEVAERIAAKANPPDKKLGDIRKKLDALKKKGEAGGSGEKP